MRFTDLMASLKPASGGFETAITDNWVQGRTTYGGLSAALCLEAVLRSQSGLPALRSAQISFLGPVGGAIRLKTESLRRGKSMSFVGADLVSDAGLATRAVFAFGAARESEVRADFVPAPKFPPAPSEIPEIPEGALLPPFAREFGFKYLTGGRFFSGSKDCDVYLWVRHRDEAAVSAPALLALADMPPPAIFPLFPRPSPISTVTWSLNFLVDPASVGGGWFLMETRAEGAADGYASQYMLVWTSDGRCIIAGRQTVAIFV